jgi:PadR family transcriptional regulator PadR
MPSDEGPHRRYYGLTERGRDQLAQAREAWKDFARVLDQLLVPQLEVTA